MNRICHSKIAMRFHILVTCLVTSLLTVACGDTRQEETAQLQAQINALQKELAATKQERDELKFGPSRMLAEAEASAAKADWTHVKAQAEALLSRHPSTPEATKAKDLLKRADASVAQAARESAAAEAKRLDEERRSTLQEERRLAAALSKMNKKVDPIENVTWYRDRTSPRYPNYNGFFLYIGKRETAAPWLRLRVQYNADDWLFIESFLVVADGQRFEYNAVEFERDNSSTIWEWYDENATDSDLDMVRAVIASKTAVVRFTGRQYRRDRTISAAEKTALRNILDAYKLLGGT